MRSRLAAIVIGACALSGCYAHASAGPSFSALRGDPGHHAAALEVHSGSVIEYVGAGPSLRFKFGERLQQVGFGPTGMLAIPGEWVVPYLNVGVHLIELNWIDDVFHFGSLSPWGQVGMLVFLGIEHEMFYLSISAGAEYPVRWTGPPAPEDVYGSGQLGFGLFTWGRPDRHRSSEPEPETESEPAPQPPSPPPP